MSAAAGGQPMTYEEFLRNKAAFVTYYGFDVDDHEVNPLAFPHQRDIIRWAVKGGRRAIFAAFGLGKSIIQLEILRLILAREGGRALIVAPLGVRGEFIRDGRKLGVDVRFIRRTEEMEGDGVYVTNFESVRDGRLAVDGFTAVSLDEASVLRSFGSKTYQTFLTLFDRVPYRYVATATPSPNRYKELIHYAGYLGVMDTGQALTRFFQRDSTKANNLRLYPHKEHEFFLWLSSWAVFLQSPADLGYDATGYDLPGLSITWERVDTDIASDAIERDGQHVMFRDAAMGLPAAAREKRETIGARVNRMLDVLGEWRDAGDLDQVVIWCDLNAEQATIERALTAEGVTYSSVHGSLPDDEAEARLDQWRDRETVALIGKPVMLGQGLNLQQCNKSVFVGITHKFNDTIQAVHRIHRFGQDRTCDVRLIYAQTETEVRDSLLAKWRQHEELTREMTEIIRAHGLDKSDIADALTRSMGVERVEVTGEGWTAVNNDCVVETRDHMATDSVDLIVTSIPFADHYEYTPSYNDFGHTDDNGHFWGQMDYLTPELRRVLRPGRIYACHVKDRINFGHVTGAGVPTVAPFHAEAIQHGIRHGLDYLGMITVVTDVVRENNQTYRLGYTEMRKDGTKMGVGSPEYIILFHKPQTDRSRGYADTPVVKSTEDYSLARWQVDAHAFWRSSGDRHLTPDELAALPVADRARLFTEQTLREVYDYEDHITVGETLQGRGALPSTFMSLAPGSWADDVWHDVNRMLTLNGEQARRNVQMHVCPLQFDIVDRLIRRFSNEGDVVFDPFGGLMTVPLRALKLGRRGRGVELNEGYFLDGVKYLQAEQRKREMPALFDLVAVGGGGGE